MGVMFKPEIAPLCFFLGVIILMIILFVISRLQEKKRKEELNRVSRKAGFSYSLKPPKDLLVTLEHFALLKKGHSRRAYNVLEGKWDGVKWVVFDYNYTEGSGKNSRTYRQTVAYADVERVKLPRFYLAPETFFHKIGQVFGLKDIDFERNPEFSKEYLLRGSDEEAVRKLFNPGVLHFFEKKNMDAYVQGEGSKCIYYKSNKRIAPHQFCAFLAEVSEVARMIMRSAPRVEFF